MDKRDEAIEKSSFVPCDHTDFDGIRESMDIYATDMCLELLEYVGRNIKWPIIADEEVLFWNGKEYLSKKQLFKNFL